MDRPRGPESSADEHWAPDHVVLAQRVLAHAGRLFAERDADGQVLTHSPLAGMATVDQRFPAWALGPFGRIESERVLPGSAGVFALMSAGVIRYVGASGDLGRTFGARHGLGSISRRDCQTARHEEMCRLNRLIVAEAQAERTVDLYVLVLQPRWSLRGRRGETPSAVAAELVGSVRGDWHVPQ